MILLIIILNFGLISVFLVAEFELLYLDWSKVFMTFPKLYVHVGGVSRILYFFNFPEFNDSINFDSKFPIK